MKVEFTVEGWTHGSYTDQIDIDDADIEGLSESEIETVVDEIVCDAVANVVSWGWHRID